MQSGQYLRMQNLHFLMESAANADSCTEQLH